MIRGLEDGGDDDRRGGTRTTGVDGGSESVTAREKMTRQRGLRTVLSSWITSNVVEEICNCEMSICRGRYPAVTELLDVDGFLLGVHVRGRR